MPHFTLEYSANLDAQVDMGKVVEVVRKAAIETGIFRSAAPASARSLRALRHRRRQSAISAFSPCCCGSAKAAISPPARKPASMSSGALDLSRSGFRQSKFALSFDMQINDKETSWKRNNIHEALKAEAPKKEAVHG